MNYKKSCFNCSLKGVIWVLMLVLPSLMQVNAQQKNVQGLVVDAMGEPVIGASVVVKGTTNGVLTDLNGTFALDAKVGDVLVISYVGYQPATVTVDGKSNVRVTLQEDSQLIDEVVVVGYGTQKKSDVTGAMVSVGAEELKARPTTNVFEACLLYTSPSPRDTR